MIACRISHCCNVHGSLRSIWCLHSRSCTSSHSLHSNTHLQSHMRSRSHYSQKHALAAPHRRALSPALPCRSNSCCVAAVTAQHPHPGSSSKACLALPLSKAVGWRGGQQQRHKRCKVCVSRLLTIMPMPAHPTARRACALCRGGKMRVRLLSAASPLHSQQLRKRGLQQH